ncbi:hypothetical protein F5Y08DRAFT_89328 [Xylaria arbuscula]|nr:hypothetical protein F5Y08DRAFT_89328 [Xylaria arbuscula]
MNFHSSIATTMADAGENSLLSELPNEINDMATHKPNVDSPPAPLVIIKKVRYPDVLNDHERPKSPSSMELLWREYQRIHEQAGMDVDDSYDVGMHGDELRGVGSLRLSYLQSTSVPSVSKLNPMRRTDNHRFTGPRDDRDVRPSRMSRAGFTHWPGEFPSDTGDYSDQLHCWHPTVENGESIYFVLRFVSLKLYTERDKSFLIDGETYVETRNFPFKDAAKNLKWLLDRLKFDKPQPNYPVLLEKPGTGKTKFITGRFDPPRFNRSNEKRSIVHQAHRSRERCMILVDIAATVISTSCAWAIRQYGRSLDQGTMNELKWFADTAGARSISEGGTSPLAKLFDKPLLPVLVFALLYAASTSTMYCLHQRDRYLVLFICLGTCASIIAGLSQDTGVRDTAVQLVPGAIALSFPISAIFHYLFVAEMDQRDDGHEFA